MKVLVIGTDLTSNGGIASVVRTFNSVAKSNNVEYSLLKTTNYKHSNFLVNQLLFIKALFKFFSMVRNVDLVHLQGSSHGSFYRKSVFLLLSKAINKPVIWNFHASRFEEFFLNKTGIQKNLIGWLLGKANSIVVLSNILRINLQEHYKIDNVTSLRNPVEPRNLSHSNLLDRHTDLSSLKVLFLGFFLKNKGVLDLLEAAENIADKNIEFLFAGTGELESAIEEATKKPQLTIKNLGWLDSDEKYSAISSSDILVLPSYREGMPIVILEAMSLGVPVISTNIAAIPELIQHDVNGYLLEPGDIDALSEGIRKMKCPVVRKKYSSLSFDKVKNYYPDAVFKDLKEIYEEVIR
ncbi:hypothetical protein RN22_15870 [Grimontia sp. AD028]|uniref:glycosyltransferase family 4 protein n=1 Tax=Grimontia sp. AD028 TaxID=1581149 RepID=UPI00061B35C3|nr:glycosyltransferase family 4 protein [Grimontia sp. AD028]KKD59394.1 hypothetical protein RN22_15870 [Grimontia sp. AD028]